MIYHPADFHLDRASPTEALILAADRFRILNITRVRPSSGFVPGRVSFFAGRNQSFRTGQLGRADPVSPSRAEPS